MLEQVKYINHLNETLRFGDDDIYVNSNRLHDFVWSIISQNDKISGFDRTIHTKSFPVRIMALSEEEGILKRNKLFEIPEKDVLAVQPGKLVVGGFYLPCYVTSSSKSFYSIEGKYLYADLVVTTDSKFWVSERFFSYDEIVNEGIDNDGFTDANFQVNIYGPAENPEFTISGHTYLVNTAVQSGETLTIDSRKEKVYITDQNGYTRSVFNYRDRDSWIFEKIPPGTAMAVSPQRILNGMDLTIYQERSEPKWVDLSDESPDAYNGSWNYKFIIPDPLLENEAKHLVEESAVYTEPSGITFAISSSEHLIERRPESGISKNYFKIENGRLIAYHD